MQVTAKKESHQLIGKGKKAAFIVKLLVKKKIKTIINIFVPNIFNPLHIGQGTISSRYCYAVWMRHMVKAAEQGLNTAPKKIAEIGPGNSLGIGLAALISGSERYYAFDVVRFANTEKNLQIFDELVELFKNRTPIPDQTEFPNVKPYLQDYSFPKEIFSDSRLEKSLEKSRLDKIRESLADQPDESIITYKVPWSQTNVVQPNSVDLIYSQAVLEHVDDLAETYRSMYAWLTSGGYMSHQIDFKCHGTAKEWNGHWTYSDHEWAIIRGRDPFLINRQPHSAHIGNLEQEGFKICLDQKVQMDSLIRPKDLDPTYRNLSKADLITSGAYILCTKQ